MFVKRLFLTLSLCVTLCAFAPEARAALPVIKYREARAPVARADEEPGVKQAGEVLVVLNEQFLNAVLEAMLSLSDPPKFPLSRDAEKNGEACTSEITLIRESMGAHTSLRFAADRIDAPVAFRGSYKAALLGCMRFEGWADTNFELSFDAARQVLTARINVRDVHLKNIPSILNGGVTALVQETIDRRINPVEILRAEQLSARLPVTQDNSLRLRARGVRHELSGKELRLHIIYEVAREK